MVQAVKNHAHLAAVFILPSGGKLDLDYLDLLDAHWVVDHATLASRDARNDAAKSILGESQEVGRKSGVEGESGPPSQRPPPSVRGGSSSGPPSTDEVSGGASTAALAAPCPVGDRRGSGAPTARRRAARRGAGRGGAR